MTPVRSAETQPGFIPAAIGLVLAPAALSLLIVAGAYVTVAFWPVPMTLQTLAVMAIPAVFGTVPGFLAMLIYLTAGCCGLPVFAGGAAGVQVLLGPTGGYLAGMLVTSLIVGPARGLWSVAACVLLCTLLIYFTGVCWLASFVGLDRAVDEGVLPFLPGAAAKDLLVVALATVFGGFRGKG